MMLSVNAKPNSEIGKLLMEKSRKDYPLGYMRQYYYYLSLASCLFALDKKNYPFTIRASMISRLLREFYPKAELLSKANEYKDLDSITEGMQSIKSWKKTSGKLKRDEDDKEEILGLVSQILIEKLKEKIKGEFSTEFINKIETLGVGKYLNENLKNKFLNITMAAKNDERSIRASSMPETSGIESLTQEIISIIEKKVGKNTNKMQLKKQIVGIYDIEKVISDRKLEDIQSIISEIRGDNLKEESPMELTRED